MGNPKQEGEQLKVRLTKELHQWVKAEALKQERSMNWIVNKAIGLMKTSAKKGIAE